MSRLTLASTILLPLAIEAGQVPQEPYRARGNNPSWSVTISNGRITYQLAGSAAVTGDIQGPEEDEGIHYYRSSSLELEVTPLACTDEAGGRRYADSVFFSVGDAQYGGCGGALLPAESLDGTSWLFFEIGGEATDLTGDLLRDDRYSISFGSDRFIGYSGCNRIGGRYRVTNGNMTIEEFGSTRHGCGEPFTRLEQTAWRVMSGSMRVSRPTPDVLELSGEAGILRLRRVEE